MRRRRRAPSQARARQPKESGGPDGEGSAGRKSLGLLVKFAFPAFSFVLLFRAYLQQRPLFATNMVGIALPVLWPFLHAKHFLISPALEMYATKWGANLLVTPSRDFGDLPIPPPPDYRDDDAWAALYPRIDTADLKSKGWYGDQDTDKHSTIDSQESAPCDLFYLPPTTFFSNKKLECCFQ